MNRRIEHAFQAAALLLCASASTAQFATVGSTPVRERLAGSVLTTEGGPTLEEGDQIAVLFRGEAVGVQTFISGDDLSEFSVVVFGDDPATPDVVEGPSFGDIVQVRFYDSSTDAVRDDLRLENNAGEAVVYRYRGQEVTDLPVDLPGLDLTPVRALDLRLGVSGTGGSGGPGSGGSGGAATGTLDIDGNGKVETQDAALILRAVTGQIDALSDTELARVDVDGDGAVTTRDAVLVLRGRNSRANTSFGTPVPTR